MREHSPDAGFGAALDRETGRSDDLESLRLRLPEAGAEYLEGALENPAAGDDEILAILRSRHASATTLAAIARDRSRMRPASAKFALVSHPKAPLAAARGFVPHLFWRHLADVAGDSRLSPILRREAEKVVRTRLPELSLGERVTLARIASPGLVRVLGDDPEPRVLEAVARNPRCTERDVERILARTDTPPEFLSWLASGSSWIRSAAMRVTLLRHPRTPVAVALRLAQQLEDADLVRLYDDPQVPRIVRVAAERRVSTAAAPAPAEGG